MSAMSAMGGIGSIMVGGIVGLIIGLCIRFFPTVIAVLRRNSNSRQVLMLNLFPLVIDIFIGILTFVLRSLLYEVSFLATLFSIVSVVWGIVSIIIWIFALIKAIRGY